MIAHTSNQVATFVRPATGVAIAIALLALLALPSGARADLLVSGASNDQIRSIDETTGNDLGQFFTGTAPNGPTGMAFGPDGSIYVVEIVGERVSRYDATTGAFLNVVVSSTDAGATDSAPEDLAFGPDGNLYVSDRLLDNVRRFNPTTGALIGTFASGNGLDNATGIHFQDGFLMVTSGGTADKVMRFNQTTGAFVSEAVVGGTAPFDSLMGPFGDLWVADLSADTIRRFDGFSNTLLQTYSVSATLDGPYDLEFQGDVLYATGLLSNNIVRFDVTAGAFAFKDTFTSGLGDSARMLFPATAGGAAPEPSTLVLAVFGLVGFALRRRRRNR